MPSSTSASPISRMLEIELFLMACLLSRRVMHTLLYYVMLCLWLDLVDMYITLHHAAPSIYDFLLLSSPKLLR